VYGVIIVGSIEADDLSIDEAATAIKRASLS